MSLVYGSYGKYKILDEIGTGAFASVYLAENEYKECYVCKISKKLSMLRQEASYLRQVSHPLFPRYIDYGEEVEKGFLFMEYVEGQNLKKMVLAGAKFSESELLEIGIQLTEGLNYLHCLRPGLLFRDIKPENIIYGKEGTVKLVDFGSVCRIGVNTSITGTIGYSAPEQLILGTRLSPRCDIYGLGKTLKQIGEVHRYGRLGRVLTACTYSEEKYRPADMHTLKKYLVSCRDTKACLTVSDKAFLKGKIILSKNIWEE